MFDRRRESMNALENEEINADDENGGSNRL